MLEESLQMFRQNILLHLQLRVDDLSGLRTDGCKKHVDDEKRRQDQLGLFSVYSVIRRDVGCDTARHVLGPKSLRS